MSNLTEEQKKILIDYIIAQPNTQTAEAIIAQQVLQLSKEKA